MDSYRAVLPQSHDLPTIFHAVVFKCLKRNSFAHTLNLLWFGVNLLFTLLFSSTETKNKVKGVRITRFIRTNHIIPDTGSPLAEWLGFSLSPQIGPGSIPGCDTSSYNV